MLIEEKAVRHWIDNFYGYGSWHARFWFIAYEEGGGDLPEEVAEKLNYFCNVHGKPQGGLCDIRELYKQVTLSRDGKKGNSFGSLYDYRFDKNAILHGVWKNLIAFVHGYENKELPDLRAYQQHTFASPSDNREALIRLYPLPSPHNHAWYYSWLDMPQLPFLKSRALYQAHVYPSRMHNILSQMRAYKPKVVLMYGMDHINKMKKSIQDFFEGAKFSMVKATLPVVAGEQIPPHHRADLNGITVLITTQIPALRHNRIETGFDWKEFGKTVRNATS